MTGPELPDLSDHPRRPALRLTTLGAVELAAIAPDGSVRPLLGAGKPTALLAYLALSPQRTASRDNLIDLLWSNTEPEQSRRNLRQCLFLLRRLLGDEALVSADDELTLAAPLAVDRDAFLAALGAGDAQAAEALYTGPFFPSFAAPGGADFEQWADLERQRLHAVWVRALEALIRQAIHGHHGRDAIQLAQRLLAADPSREASQRLLLESVISTEHHAS